jgi:hypothetical protein
VELYLYSFHVPSRCTQVLCRLLWYHNGFNIKYMKNLLINLVGRGDKEHSHVPIGAGQLRTASLVRRCWLQRASRLWSTCDEYCQSQYRQFFRCRSWNGRAEGLRSLQERNRGLLRTDKQESIKRTLTLVMRKPSTIRLCCHEVNIKTYTFLPNSNLVCGTMTKFNVHLNLWGHAHCHQNFITSEWKVSK